MGSVTIRACGGDELHHSFEGIGVAAVGWGRQGETVSELRQMLRSWHASFSAPSP